ncbi:DUF533 domain-containing protein [Microvirga pudoricolor]|uniref:DUF533 domain-containing protein n=1 Tax=Microvirga pudoricolor TaxID=2778729 RepID=UPI00194E1676|nr:DUF533 domain-containing protein [Microvirga pudoricolor]MBM6594700.1 DUF533 domain-containing protein [Microvirga pudoricolor]
MFDAKKLLDALGSQAQPATSPAAPGPSEPPKAETAKGDPAKPGAHPFGAGTLLSDLIGLANRPDTPPPPASEKDDKAESTPATAPKPKPAAPAQPADLTDLLLGKAQEYLKTPQGNAAMNALVLGLTKAAVNSDMGRKLTSSAVSKGTALFNRFMKKPDEPAASIPAIEAATTPAGELPPPAAPQAGAMALLLVRAMIAAAAADGTIDDGERGRILGTLKQAGIDGEGVHIVEAELAHPASVAELAAAAKVLHMETQVYTTARQVITPNTVEERIFLAHLAGALGLDPRLVAQIDAAASA